jgi:hypothetical protein
MDYRRINYSVLFITLGDFSYNTIGKILDLKTKESFMTKIKRSLHLLAIIFGMALVMPGVALAAHFTISTTDSSVSDWTGVEATVTDGDDAGVDDNWDINQAWVANNSDQSEMYFRVNLVGSGAFPGLATYRFIEARVDCNRDSDHTDAEDVVVYYDPASSSAGECQGNNYPDCSPSYALDENGDSFGQNISGTPNNYEFKADTANGKVDWSACNGQVSVTFATFYYGTPPGNVTYDSTSAVEINVPTVVKMNDISARSKSTNRVSMVLIIAGVLLITGQSIIKRKENL